MLWGFACGECIESGECLNVRQYVDTPRRLALFATLEYPTLDPMLQAWSDDKSLLNLQRRAHISWEDGSPRTVLLVKKDNNKEASGVLKKMGSW